MKVGIIVDGSAESQALRNLLMRLDVPNIQVLPPIHADMQPKAAPGQIAKSAISRIEILRSKGAGTIIILMDREDRVECPSQLARLIEKAFDPLGYPEIQVVIKNRRFENWLVADLDAIKRIKRFQVTRALEGRVAPNKADNISNAEQELSRISREGSYHKRRDATLITAQQDCLKVAENSRSFRRLLRLIGHPKYIKQSKKP